MLAADRHPRGTGARRPCAAGGDPRTGQGTAQRSLGAFSRPRRAAGHARRTKKPQTFTCSLVGSYTPFATTKAQREANNDARPSIAERYRNRDDYVNRIRIAAYDLIESGFLLPEDAAIIIQAAAAHPGFSAQLANPAPR